MRGLHFSNRGGVPGRFAATPTALILTVLLALGACDGAISDPSGTSPLDPTMLPEGPAPAIRAVRLTHAQWEQTVVDLLGVDPTVAERIASGFRSDPRAEGFIFDNLASAFEVDDALYGSYQRAALELAQIVSSDAGLRARIYPAGTTPDAFVRDFGAKVHRRPLTGDEVTEYAALHAMGPTLYPDLPAEEAGVRLALEGFLQSPGFLYRFEGSSNESDGVIPLDSYEVASRLSYALWNSMPDPALFEAAATGALGNATGVRAEAERLLAEPRAADAIRAFHHSLFEVEKYSAIAPSAAFYPDAPSNLGDLARQEGELFVADAFESGSTYREMLTTTRTFANAHLAEIYGLDPAGMTAEFIPVELDPEQRRGFLTQTGFLVAHATSVDPDPIHRGVFVAKRLQCISIAAPPEDIPPLPAPEPGRTNRQTVEAHTQRAGTICASCHATIINPLGFPFEAYDSLGAFRTEDAGQMVDSTSNPLINGVRTPVTGAPDLAEALAASDRVHACYTRRWVEFLLGRPSAIEDRPLYDRIAPISQAEGLTLREVVVEIVTSRGFLTRSREELP